MMPLRIGKAALLLALLAPLPLQAQEEEARISVTLTPNPVPEHGNLQLQVAVEAPLESTVSQPVFQAPDFVLIANSWRMEILSGNFSPNSRKSLIYTFVLTPKHAGTFPVRKIETSVAGKSLSARDLSVTVTPGEAGAAPTPPPASDDEEASNPASPNYHGRGNTGAPTPAPPHGGMTIPDRFNSDFTVWASLNKTRAYVGEPIVVEYYLYDFGGLRQTEVQKWPTFDGFWKEDLELTPAVTFEEVYIQQREMRRGFLARYALYGIKPGKINVDQLGIRGKYEANDSLGQGIFMGMDLRTGQHYSQDIRVEILPLPEAGKPEKFSGAVGKFTLKVEADKLKLAQNTPVTFTITLAGTGNFQAIDSIKLPLPPDFELYEATANGRAVAPIGVRQELESKKSFQVVAIPRKAGKFEVAPLSWSYFDTEKGSYETLTTAPISLEVDPAENGPAASNTYLGPKAAGGPDPDALRPLKADPLSPRRTWLDFLPLAIWAALALNLLLGFRFLKNRSRRLYKLVKGVDRFSEARILLLQAKGIRDAEWQAGLEEAVFMTLQVLLGTNPRGLTKHDLEESWKAHALPAPLFQRVNALLEELDRHRFSSQKLTGSGTKELRSRLTKEAESVLVEASQTKRR